MKVAAIIKSTHLNQQGFSLIELLVVLLIIGFGIGMVAVNVGLGDDDARSQAKQFANLSAMVADEAVINQQPWGIDIFRTNDAPANNGSNDEVFAYRWLQRVYWTPSEESNEQPRWLWLPVAPKEIEAELFFSSQLTLRLEMESIELEIGQKVPVEKKPENQKIEIKPDIYFWGNGEITPFKVQFYSRNNEQLLHTVSGDLLGRIALDLADDE